MALVTGVEVSKVAGVLRAGSARSGWRSVRMTAMSFEEVMR